MSLARHRQARAPQPPPVALELRRRLDIARLAMGRPYLEPEPVSAAVEDLAELAALAAELLILLRVAVSSPVERAAAVAAQTWGELEARFPELEGEERHDLDGEDLEGDELDLLEGGDL